MGRESKEKCRGETERESEEGKCREKVERESGGGDRKGKRIGEM